MENIPPHFTDILTHLKRAYISVDAHWQITFASPRCKEILATAAEQLAGRDMRDALPDIISLFYKTLKTTLLLKKTGIKTSFYGPTQKLLELASYPTETGMLVICQDISNIEKKNAEVRDSKIQHQAILDTLNDALITIDDKGLITNFNPAAEKMFGYSSEEVTGQNVSLLLPPEDRTQHEDYTAYSDLHQTRIINQSRELFGQHKCGKIFPIELNVSPLHAGNQFGYLGIIRDITERKLAEQQILEEKDRAEQANQAKTEFLSCMSHELRTPLNAILGFTQILQMEKHLASQHKEYAVEIHRAGKHLLAMVEDILNFTQVEAGNLTLNIATVSFNELLDECMPIVDQMCQEKNIEMIFAPSCQQVHLIADPVRLRQVLFNLLSNAVKYNHPGGKVKVDCANLDKQQVRIAISDTGPGIEQAQLESLFEPFNRLGKENSSVQGAGLGLSICKQLVEAMGGEIAVENTPGQGSLFWFELPRADRDT